MTKLRDQVVHWGTRKHLNLEDTAKALSLAMGGMMIETEVMNLMEMPSYKQDVKKSVNRLFENILPANIYIQGKLISLKGIASGSSEVRRRIMEGNPHYTQEQLVSVLCRSFLEYYRALPEHCSIFYAKTSGSILAVVRALKTFDDEEDVSALTNHFYMVEEEFKGKLKESFDEFGYPRPVKQELKNV